MEKIALNELSLGGSAKVCGLNFLGQERQRMLDLGLCEGSEVEAVLKSASGNPVAYLVKGALIAIRGCDARKILVTPIKSIREAREC